MAAGSTYTPIATTTLGSNVASYTFSSIPSTYTDLVVVFNGTQTIGGSTMYCILNGDTGTNYSSTLLNGNGTTASSTRSSNSSGGLFFGGWLDGLSVTNPATTVFQLFNYSNTTTYKTSMSRYSQASSETNTGVSLWRNTAAVTSLQITIAGNNIKAGSTFTLYGIQAA